MIKSINLTTHHTVNTMHNSKTSQSYSVQSILNKNDDYGVLDLSIKEKMICNNQDQPTGFDACLYNEKTPEKQSSDKMKQVFMNVIQQKELQSHLNRQMHSHNQQSTKSNLDNLQKFCYYPIQNSNWNFLKPLSNLSESGTNMLNQFQKFLLSNHSLNPSFNHQHSLYQRRKNLFPHSPNDSIPNYIHNFPQLFHSRINSNASSDASSHLSALSENYSKQYSNPNIDINTHFNLQNILKSSSNRKRKRTKVTDTRLPRRNSSQGLNNFSQIHETTIAENSRFSNYLNPPSNSSQSSHSDETPGDPKRYTLTPIHLRKAKLMFLYTRYPNSQMLKSYFPDITFYKQNTAQLVKWFSNFREFYYSEMEKAVQRAISNGIQYAKDIDVTVESELFKNLMTHFNKKKQIVVPCEFLTTVQITLREFFDAISSGKNLHQSWKKPIYKTIAKIDQILPEFFKDMNWMMELAKDENDNMIS